MKRLLTILTSLLISIILSIIGFFIICNSYNQASNDYNNYVSYNIEKMGNAIIQDNYHFNMIQVYSLKYITIGFLLVLLSFGIILLCVNNFIKMYCIETKK